MPKSLRTISVLAAVAALLLAYILFFERGSVSSSEFEQRKGSALPEFVRARVSRIEIQRKGATIVLSRNPELSDEGGLWQVDAPFQSKADSQLVDGLLSELEYLDARRRIERVTAKDKAQFGLDKPRYRMTITVGRVRIPVVVGSESPRGDGVYLQGSDRSLAYVVSKDLIAAIDHDPTDYHTKELHEGVLVTTSQALSLRDAQGERGAHRLDSTLWTLDKPALGLASAPTIAEIINALDALRAKHFVIQHAKDLAPYGLAEPRFELVLHRTHLVSGDAGIQKQANGEPKREQKVLRLRVGSTCEGHPGESYVAIDEAASGVYCALDADLQKLERSLAELTEARLLPLDDDEIEAVQLEHAGRRLSLRKNKEEWSYEASRPSAQPEQGKARTDAVKAWFAALRASKIVRAEPASTAIQANAIALRVERVGGKAAYVLRVDATHQPRAQRDDEAQALVLEPSALEQLDPSPVRLKPLALLQLDESSLRKLELVSGGVSERLSRPDASAPFTLETPLRAPVDNAAGAELTRLLSSLEAVRFVSDSPDPKYGLEPPQTTLSFDATRADDKAAVHIVLRVGAQTSEGRYAQLDDRRDVFVIATELARLLSEPLVSRSLLSTPLEEIASIRVEHADKAIAITRAGDGFVSDAKTATGANANEIATTVATLRATRATSYGAGNSHELGKAPWARIRITTKPGSEQRDHMIVIGDQTSDGGRFARRDDFAVGFELPKDAVDALSRALGAH